MKTEFLMLFGGLFVIFVGLSVLFPSDEEPKPTDFCDTIFSFEFDPDYICAERFEDELREVCEGLDPDVDTCMLMIVMELSESCIGYEETFGISEEVCFYKKTKNFKSDFERLNK